MLSQEQRKIVREHPTKASFLIDKLKNKDPYLKEFILNHHERPKGKGFSRGLDAEKLDQNICYFIIAHEIASHLIEEKISLERLMKIIDILKQDYSYGNFQNHYLTLKNI